MKLHIEKVIGCPLKITAHNTVYIPSEYLRHYKINERYDKLIKEQYPRSIIYHRFQNRPLNANERIVPIQGGLTNVTAAWLRKNDLTPGDLLFLIGTHDGFLLHIVKK